MEARRVEELALARAAAAPWSAVQEQYGEAFGMAAAFEVQAMTVADV